MTYRSIRISADVWETLRRAAAASGSTMRITADEFLGEALKARGIPRGPAPTSPEAIADALAYLNQPDPEPFEI